MRKTAMLNPSRLSKGQVALAFLAGAAAGAVTAYLISPRNGAQNRDALRELARGLKSRAVGDVDRVPERLRRAARAAGEAFGGPGDEELASLNSY